MYYDLAIKSRPSPPGASRYTVASRFRCYPLWVWVHCPRASNGLLPPRSNLVGYVRWYARSDSVLFLPPSDNHSNSFQFAHDRPYRDRFDLPSALPTRIDEGPQRDYCGCCSRNPRDGYHEISQREPAEDVIFAREKATRKNARPDSATVTHSRHPVSTRDRRTKNLYSHSHTTTI